MTLPLRCLSGRNSLGLYNGVCCCNHMWWNLSLTGNLAYKLDNQKSFVKMYRKSLVWSLWSILWRLGMFQFVWYHWLGFSMRFLCGFRGILLAEILGLCVWWTWPLILIHRLFSLFPWGCQPVIFSKLNAYKSVHWYRRGHWVTASSQHISSWLEDLQLWWGSCPGYTRSMSMFFVVCRCGRPWWQGVSQFFYGVLHPLWNVNLKRTLVH